MKWTLLIGLLCHLNFFKAHAGSIYQFGKEASPVNCAKDMPTLAEFDSCFLTTLLGVDLRGVKVNGIPLSLTKGVGEQFAEPMMEEYRRLKSVSSMKENLAVFATPTKKEEIYWGLVELNRGQMIAQSSNSQRKIFGASVSKIFVAGALLDHLRGKITSRQLQLLADMLVISSNSAWTDIQQNELGEGDVAKGQERIWQFTQRLGYQQTRAWQGYWGDVHGNELTVQETARFLVDMFHGRFSGAETLWKILFTARLGVARGLRFLPQDLFVGGKTGTYAGESVDPYTLAPIELDVRHHVFAFSKNQRSYGLVLFSNNLTDEQVAIFSRGLIAEYL